MAFFISDNPIALFMTLVVVVVVLKLALAKHKWFKGDKAPNITYILIVVILLLLFYRPLPRMLSIGIPFAILIIMLSVGVCALLFALGMPKGTIWKTLRGIGPFKLALQISVVCIIAFAASQVYGSKLLEDQSVSFADSMLPEEKKAEIDFSPLFTKSALGMMLILAVMGFAFFFINFTK